MMPHYKKIIPLNTTEMAVPLYVYDSGTSSLDVAWELEKQNLLPIWGAVLLEKQTSGRGRQGRVWQSPPGHIFGAVRLPSSGPPFDGPGAALAMAFLLAQVLDDFGWKVHLKWPNDLILDGCKIGGILLESKKNTIVAGVGFNLLAVPEGSWQAEREAGAPPPGALPFTGEPEVLWSALVKKVILLYKGKFEGVSMAELTDAAEKILLWRGETVIVTNPATLPPHQPQAQAKSTMIGRILGLGPEGHLIIANDTGQYRLWSGTVCLAST